MKSEERIGWVVMQSREAVAINRQNQAAAKKLCAELGEVLRETMGSLDQLRGLIKGRPGGLGTPE